MKVVRRKNLRASQILYTFEARTKNGAEVQSLHATSVRLFLVIVRGQGYRIYKKVPEYVK